MCRIILLSLFTVFAVAAHAEEPAKAPQSVTPAEIINTMESGGVHSGFRRNHAKGLCFEGTFTPTRKAKDLSSSNLFKGPAVKVVGRFSNPGPDPTGPDNKPMPRGMALHFAPKSGGTSNMTMLDVPAFSASTPEEFNEVLKVKTPEQAAAFQKKYPRSVTFYSFLKDHGIPQSYGTVDYHSLHAFKMTNAKGKSQFVRWNFVSEQGNHFLTADQAKDKPANFLTTTLQDELKKGPLKWKMEVIFSKEGDSLVDPTTVWSGDRKTMEMGTLALTKTSGNGTAECDGINYDPNQLAEGIAPSDDPVLRFRSPAYAISFGKRSSEKAQTKKQ